MPLIPNAATHWHGVGTAVPDSHDPTLREKESDETSRDIASTLDLEVPLILLRGPAVISAERLYYDSRSSAL